MVGGVSFHIIYSDGVELYPKKTKAVKNWPRVLTPTDIRCFLRLERYYRMFKDGFASISSLLNNLIQKSEILVVQGM